MYTCTFLSGFSTDILRICPLHFFATNIPWSTRLLTIWHGQRVLDSLYWKTGNRCRCILQQTWTKVPLTYHIKMHVVKIKQVDFKLCVLFEAWMHMHIRLQPESSNSFKCVGSISHMNLVCELHMQHSLLLQCASHLTATSGRVHVRRSMSDKGIVCVVFGDLLEFSN